MLKSMTGYSFFTDRFNEIGFEIEMKSLNSRFFDCYIRTDYRISFLEPLIRTELKSKIYRGKIDVNVKLNIADNSLLNEDVIIARAKKFSYMLEEIRSDCNIGKNISLSDILKCPELFKCDEDFNKEEFKEYFKSVFNKALKKLINFREDEGIVLEKDLNICIEKVLVVLENIKLRYPLILSEYKARITSKISEILDGKDINGDRVLTEVAILTDKMDINEEIVRLENHLYNLSLLLKSEVPVGKKMDFTLQEANREINTIGSKVNDIEISSFVIDIKSEVEKMREQVQNIE